VMDAVVYENMQTVREALKGSIEQDGPQMRFDEVLDVTVLGSCDGDPDVVEVMMTVCVVVRVQRTGVEA
jgi:hypothetical protein